jgi:hypothetical protein
MGVEKCIILNNNIYENNMETTVNKLCERLDLEYEFVNNYTKRNNDIKIFIENEESFYSKKIFEDTSSLEIRIYNQSFTLCKNSICLYDYDESKLSFVSSWSCFMYFLRGQYKKTDEDYDSFIKYKINELKEFGKLFESNQLIIFAEDEDNTEDELDEGETIENILKKPRWEIITPKDIPIYYNEQEFEKYYKSIENRDENKYFGLNCIYYDLWEYKSDFNELIWKDKFINKVDE